MSRQILTSGQIPNGLEEAYSNSMWLTTKRRHKVGIIARAATLPRAKRQEASLPHEVQLEQAGLFRGHVPGPQSPPAGSANHLPWPLAQQNNSK